MLQVTVINILLLLSSFLTIIASLIVYTTRKKFPANAYLTAGLISTAVWGFAVYVTISTGNILIGNLAFASAALIPAFLILFVLSFSEILTKKWQWIVLLPAFAIAILSLIPKLLSEEISVSKGSIEMIKAGRCLVVYDSYFIIYAVILFYLLFSAQKKSEGVRKVQMDYLIFGLGLSLLFGALFNMLLPLFGIFEFNNLGPVFILFMSSAVAYAATRHYLGETQVIFSELWASLLILILVVWLAVNFSLFNFIIFALVISICILFVRTVLSEARKNHELIRQKRQLEVDKNDLQKLDRMKDEFLNMATHELNTPVSVLRGKLSMIFDENFGGFSQGQKDFLRPALIQTKRLIRLFQQILEVAQIDQGKVDLSKNGTNLIELLQQSMKKYDEEAGQKGVTLTLEKSKEYELLIDAGKISEAFENLLSNAIKFTPEKGHVVAKVSDDGDQVRISVADEGIGIEKENAEHIFEKFYQAGRFDKVSPVEQQGSGLGLYIVRKYIELHGGKIGFESSAGKGTVFYFTLPLK